VSTERRVPAELAAPTPPTPPIADERVVLADHRLLEECSAPRSMVVFKAARKLELYCGDALAARFDTSLSFAAADGNKEKSGDSRTPEGDYYVTLKYHSKFHRSLQLSYPSIHDAERGLAKRIITRRQFDAIASAIQQCRNPPQDTGLGGLVQIHGGGGGTDVGDWTLGCVAVDNGEIEQVFAFHRPGCDKDGVPLTKITVRP
jgi:murein L,D-transpeptidase YafK